MTKAQRQELIKNLIKEFEFDTQNDLVDYLNSQGLAVTQATVSRDIKAMGILKVKGKVKKFKYALDDIRAQKIQKIYSNIVKKIITAQNLIVITTSEGSAGSVATFIDKSNIEGVLGTIAGDDTILIVTADNNEALRLRNELSEILK